METKHLQSNIALRSNGETPGKKQYSEQYENPTRKGLLSVKDNEVS